MPRAPRRTGVDECFHYLGEVGALMFFARAALDPGAKGADLLAWTLRLQRALLAHPTDATLKPLKIDAPQISTWRRANPIVWAPPEQMEQALSLRVLAIEMAQAVAEPETSHGWKGHLLIVFEPRTETLVHHFLKLNRTAEVSADWILYVLARADRAIRERTASIRAPQDSVSIALPDLKDTPYAEAYAEAATRLTEAIPAGGLTVTWLGRHEACLTLHDAYVDTAAPRDSYAALTLETSQLFRNALIRTARAFNALSDKGGGVWIALNPQKGDIDRKPGWEEEERLRRLAAASRHEDTAR